MHPSRCAKVCQSWNGGPGGIHLSFSLLYICQTTLLIVLSFVSLMLPIHAPSSNHSPPFQPIPPFELLDQGIPRIPISPATYMNPQPLLKHWMECLHNCCILKPPADPATLHCQSTLAMPSPLVLNSSLQVARTLHAKTLVWPRQSSATRTFPCTSPEPPHSPMPVAPNHSQLRPT
mmetsp:Transcript_34882/g.62336  ORF Transcript_34882/g.62336 Transcript_34882/m.62336 type:complete len:176 (-) Transcript_34882:96-623(-)